MQFHLQHLVFAQEHYPAATQAKYCLVMRERFVPSLVDIVLKWIELFKYKGHFLARFSKTVQDSIPLMYLGMEGRVSMKRYGGNAIRKLERSHGCLLCS